MMASPHFAQMRLVRWLSSSRFASEARAVFESSPFFGMKRYSLRQSSILETKHSVMALALLTKKQAHIHQPEVYHSRPHLANQERQSVFTSPVYTNTSNQDDIPLVTGKLICYTAAQEAARIHAEPLSL